jgi:hypothetical protein
MGIMITLKKPTPERAPSRGHGEPQLPARARRPWPAASCRGRRPRTPGAGRAKREGPSCRPAPGETEPSPAGCSRRGAGRPAAAVASTGRARRPSAPPGAGGVAVEPRPQRGPRPVRPGHRFWPTGPSLWHNCGAAGVGYPHEQADAREGRPDRPVETACGLQHHQRRGQRLALRDQRGDPGLGVGRPPACAGRAPSDVALGCGSIHPPHPLTLGPRRLLTGPTLPDTGSLAPDNCSGSSRNGRDDPGSLTVSPDLRSSGLSRPGSG